MTKQLSPLRRKDIETGRKLENSEIVKWLPELDKESGEINRYIPTTLANWIVEGMHKS